MASRKNGWAADFCIFPSACQGLVFHDILLAVCAGILSQNGFLALLWEASCLTCCFFPFLRPLLYGFLLSGLGSQALLVSPLTVHSTLLALDRAWNVILCTIHLILVLHLVDLPV